MLPLSGQSDECNAINEFPDVISLEIHIFNFSCSLFNNFSQRISLVLGKKLSRCLIKYAILCCTSMDDAIFMDDSRYELFLFMINLWFYCFHNCNVKIDRSKFIS